MLNKKDDYIEVFMGTTYEIGNPKSIGGLKSVLQEILDDLPEDEELKIAEVDLRQGKLSYILEEGIPK